MRLGSDIEWRNQVASTLGAGKCLVSVHGASGDLASNWQTSSYWRSSVRSTSVCKIIGEFRLMSLVNWRIRVEQIPGAILRLVDGKVGAALLVSSAFVSLLLAAFGGFTFFRDSTTFFEYAIQLTNFRAGSYYYSPGYPFVIAITGFPATSSVVPLLILQATFAAFTPWLAFKTFAPYDRRAGVTSGIVCLASLTPFFFQNTFFHDGTFLFFGFVATAFASTFFARGRPRYLYLSLACAMFSYFTQPAGIGFVIGYVGAFSLFALYDRRQLKHAVLAIGICLTLVASFSAFQKWSLRQDGLPVVTSAYGRKVFFSEYLQGSPYVGFAGAAADKLRHELVDYFGSPAFHSNSAESAHILVIFRNQAADYRDLFGQYQGRETDLVDQIFAQPNRVYYEVLRYVTDMHDGVADDVFLQASLAYLYQHPLVVVRFMWKNLVDLTIGLPWSCRGQEVFPACRIPQLTPFYPAINQLQLAPGRMPDKAYRFLTSRGDSRSLLMRAADSAWQWIYHNFRVILLAAMLFGWLASYWGPATLRWSLGAFIAAYMANMLVYSFFAEPEFRYQIVSIAMSAFAAGPGIYSALYLLTHAAIPGDPQTTPSF